MGLSDIVSSSFSLEHPRPHESEFPAFNRVRRSTMASTSQSVEYVNTESKKFRLMREGTADYLQVSQNAVTVGPLSENDSCFSVHKFNSLSPHSILMVFQSHDGNFLAGGADGAVSLVEASNIENALVTDEKFFLLKPNGNGYTIKHLHTDKFLSGSNSGQVSLVSGSNDNTDDIRFDMFNCSESHS